MTKCEATALIENRMKAEHGVSVKVTWKKYGKTKTPTGIEGYYGFCKVESKGFKPKAFTFTTFNGNYKLSEDNQVKAMFGL